MRRRRGGGWLHLAVLPLMVVAQSVYDAQPIGRPAERPRQIARGYQPPPLPMIFEAPRSHHNYPSQFHSYRQPSINGNVDGFMIPPMNAGVGRPALPQSPAPPQIQFQNQNNPYGHYAPNIEQWNLPGYPRPQATAPHRFVYTPEIKPHSVAGPPAVQPRPDFFSSPPRITQENPPDVLNNIIVHIYLNAKGKQVHATATSGPIKGIFGIGTSHGGPGTHSNPIVITKDFDRDTLKFVEEHKAQQMVEEGPANIVEVKATVSSPDRKMDHSLNKAVNSELDRAIPLVLNRMQGPMRNLDDDDLRKELEQALVDELAKNLGETIDQMGTSGVDDDDLGKLIEEGFNEIEKELQASSSTFTPPATTTTQPRRITTTTTGRRTTSSTTSRRTTTSVVEEMMEESPFERTQPPVHGGPSSRKTSPPRTTKSTRPTTTSVRTTPEATTEWWMTTTHPTTTKTTTRRTTTVPRTRTTPSSTTTSTSATTHPTIRTTRPTTTEPWWMSTTPHAATTSRPTTVKPETMTTPWWMSTSPPTASTTRPVTTTSRQTTTPPWWMIISSSEVTTSRPTTTTRAAPWWMSTSPPTIKTTRPSSTTQWWMTTTLPAEVVTRPTAAATETWTTPWWMASPSSTASTTPATTRTRPTTTTPRFSPTTPRATTAKFRQTTTTARLTTATTPPMTTTSQPSPTVRTESTRPPAATSRATTTSVRPTPTTPATVGLVPESSAKTLHHWRPPTTTTTPSTTRSVVFFTTTSAPGRWRTTEVTFRTVPLHEQPTTEVGLTHREEVSMTRVAPAKTTTKPSTFAEQNMINRQPHFEVPPRKQTVPSGKQGESTLWREGEPRIVTSRPVHVVSLDEDTEATTRTTRRGTTMGRRITTTTTTTSTSTTEAPHTAIFEESAFGTGTTTTTTAPITAPPTSSTITSPTSSATTTLFWKGPSEISSTTVQLISPTTTTAESPAMTKRPEKEGEPEEVATKERPSTPTAEFPEMPELPQEKVQPEEDKGRFVVKERPSSFGDQNMAKMEIESSMLEEGLTMPTEQPEIVQTTMTSTGQPETVKAVTTPTAQAETPKPTTTSTEQPKTIETTTTSRLLSPETVPTLIREPTTTEAPPFEVGPGMFEESAKPTVAHRGPVESGGYGDELTSLPPEAETVQPVPETFFMPKEPCPTVNDPSDTNRTDVLFLLDSSNAFNQQKFMHAIKLIIETVSQFRNIGPNGTQVSLVQFNTEPYLEFSLRKHNCKQWLIDDIADTDYMQGGSMLGKAVEKVSRFAFTKNRGDRPDAENVLVILTDGQSDDRIQEPVEVAKKHNLTVLVIATLEANPQYLMDLAGNMNNVFQLHTDIKHTLPHKLAERINSIQAEFAPSDSFEVKDGHGMITVALPTEEEEEGEQVEQMGEEEEEMDDGRDGQKEEEFPVVTHTSVPIVPTVSSPSSISMDAQRLVQLQCSPLGFKISLNVPPGYEGVAVVKGQEDKEECTKNIHALESSTNLTVGFFVASKSCGVTRVHSEQPPGTNYTLILHLKHSVPLVTGGDRAYLLQCYIGKPSEDQELTADLGVMKGELMIAETISLLSVPPTCVYSIRKDSADGPIVKNAYVGQTVYHRWECDGGEEANNVYGIQIHDCFASDDVDKKFPIVDNRGCSSDLTLLSDPRYSDSSLTAYAESKAFAFTEADQLKFVCKLSLCTRDGDGCEGVTPPVCGGNSPEQLVTRRIRHQNSAMEGALSSALSTRVGVATSIPSTLKGRLTNLLSSGGSWIVLALLAIIATVGTVVLSRFALSSPYATTTCSDPETMSSPPTSPFPSLFSSPPMSPTPRVDSPPTSSISSPVPAESAPREELAICEISEEPSPGPPSQGDAGQSPIEAAPVSDTTVEPPQSSERRPSRAEMNKRLAPFLVDFDRSKYV